MLKESVINQISDELKNRLPKKREKRVKLVIPVMGVKESFPDLPEPVITKKHWRCPQCHQIPQKGFFERLGKGWRKCLICNAVSQGKTN